MIDMQPHQPRPTRRSTARWARFAALAVLGVLTSACPALALNVTYVTPRGNDANDCLAPATPCKTITAAIDKAAALGSPVEVRIAKGTYREFISASASNSVFEMTLSGNWDMGFTTQSPKTPTMLRPDTRVSGRVMVLSAGGTIGHLTATLSNLTITGGNQTANDGDLPGAGLAIVTFDPAVATVVLDRVTMTANRFNQMNVSGGAALGARSFLGGTIDLTVRDSVFSRNTSRWTGGAIQLENLLGGHVNFIAERTMFQSNSAAVRGGAIAVVPDGGTIDTTLVNCFASGNIARQDGGGVSVDLPGGSTVGLTLENCSFTANTATTGRGGAVRVGDVGGTFAMEVRNTIAWHDMAKVGADDISLGAGVTAANCSIASSNVGELDGTCGDGGGNVVPAVDPKFVAPKGPNLHLKPTSPLRGLGNCAAGPSDDIDGQSRPQGPGCDIGADEIP